MELYSLCPFRALTSYSENIPDYLQVTPSMKKCINKDQVRYQISWINDCLGTHLHRIGIRPDPYCILCSLHKNYQMFKTQNSSFRCQFLYSYFKLHYLFRPFFRPLPSVISWEILTFSIEHVNLKWYPTVYSIILIKRQCPSIRAVSK